VVNANRFVRRLFSAGKLTPAMGYGKHGGPNTGTRVGRWSALASRMPRIVNNPLHKLRRP